MTPLRLAVLSILSAALCPNLARAQDLSEARRLYLDADFDAATAQFEQLLSSPGLTRLEAVEAHRYLAGLHALAGQQNRVSFHVEAALALDATVSAPEGSSPELQAHFEHTRRDRAGRMASLRFDVLPSQGHKQLRLELRDAPSGLVQTLALRCVSGPKSLRNTSSDGRLMLELDAASSWNCQAEAQTSGRATLISESHNIAATLTQRNHDNDNDTITAVEDPTIEGDEAGFPWLWLVAGVLVVGAGATTVALLSADSGPPKVTGFQVDGW